jgi:hypothetical protein
MLRTVARWRLTLELDRPAPTSRGEACLKDAWAAASGSGCRGRSTRRRKPSRGSMSLMLRSASTTPNRAAITRARSVRRQRTTPCSARSGPRRTHSATSASCSEDRNGLGPTLPRLSDSPASPCSLHRCTQSRSVCRSMPAACAASIREASSRTRARASMRRDAAALRVRRASRRRPAASKSDRVIWAAPAMLISANRVHGQRITPKPARESREAQTRPQGV